MNKYQLKTEGTLFLFPEIQALPVRVLDAETPLGEKPKTVALRPQVWFRSGWKGKQVTDERQFDLNLLLAEPLQMDTSHFRPAIQDLLQIASPPEPQTQDVHEEQTDPDESNGNGWEGDPFLLEAWLSEIVVEHTLATLASRGNAEGKREAIEWFFAPDRYCVNVRGKAVHRALIPFTFQRAARCMGIHAERLLEHLASLLRHRGLGELIPMGSGY